MRIFIGSSGEQKRLVEWLTQFIRSEYSGRIDPVPWTIPWPGGRFTLEHLLRIVDETDAAILFWTADDKTWYRDTLRQEPRDNLVFEAGLFIAAHGRDRAQLMIPQYDPGDSRAKVAVPSDVVGMTWNQYQWVDGPAEATGLPAKARMVCDYLLKLGSRPRKTQLLPSLVNRKNVEEINTFVGDWHTISVEGLLQIAQSKSARSIDILAAYRVGTIHRMLGEFRQQEDAKLRACFGNMFDIDLLHCYQRKYYNRDDDHIQKALIDSIKGLLGQCKVEVASAADIRITEVETPPKANYEIRLTNQRITYGYYRVDNIAFLVPLDMKREQDPAPLAWVLDRDTGPRAFQHYLDEYDRMYAEAVNVFHS